MPAASTPALELRHLSRAFGGVAALDDVALTILPGEVHGLLGQNGSGKSTLIKVLAGFHAPAPGAQLALYGRPVRLPLHPNDFRRLGLAFVHQHLGLLTSLSVIENMRIGELAARQRWFISWPRERRQVERLFARFHLDIDVAGRVGDLPQVERALLAIVRAFEDLRAHRSTHGGHGILVLDEPTPFLPRPGVEQLFRLVREIVREGASVLFVSHDVDEVIEITDRATVLRDGKVAGTLTSRDATADDFVTLIVGRRITPFRAPPREQTQRAAGVTVTALSGGSVDHLSITAQPGEIIGLTGLIGAGFDEVPYLLFGATPAVAGQLTIGATGHDIAAMTPVAARAAGIALLPADRPHASGVGRLPVGHNVTLPVVGAFMRGLWLDLPGLNQRARALGRAHDVRPNDPPLPLDALSGGNQQKALLAKWLQTAPRLLLLDEPTQGVDVGARQQVYQALHAAATAGTTILCASTDAEQLAALCSRVLIFAHGQVVRELVGADVTKDRISAHCYGSADLQAWSQTDGAHAA